MLHVDTGHNFPEVIDFRDRTVERLGLKLVVGSVQEFIDRGELAERADGTRNPLQTVLLDAIQRNKFDAVFGGGRRDEDKARAKEHPEPARRVRPVGPAQPAPRAVEPLQRPPHRGQHVRAFPSATGPSWTCGATSSARTSSCPACTTPTTARSLPATACGAQGRGLPAPPR